MKTLFPNLCGQHGLTKLLLLLSLLRTETSFALTPALDNSDLKPTPRFCRYHLRVETASGNAASPR